jgi:hypothetical protein
MIMLGVCRDHISGMFARVAEAVCRKGDYVQDLKDLVG